MLGTKYRGFWYILKGVKNFGSKIGFFSEISGIFSKFQSGHPAQNGTEMIKHGNKSEAVFRNKR